MRYLQKPKVGYPGNKSRLQDEVNYDKVFIKSKKCRGELNKPVYSYSSATIKLPIGYALAGIYPEGHAQKTDQGNVVLGSGDYALIFK